MKKLEKNFKKHRNTIEGFGCFCTCSCPCAYCASTWISQHNADVKRTGTISNNNVMY